MINIFQNLVRKINLNNAALKFKKQKKTINGKYTCQEELQQGVVLFIIEYFRDNDSVEL